MPDHLQFYTCLLYVVTNTFLSPGPMSEISSDLIGRTRARGRIRVRSRTFFRSDLEVEPEPLLEVQMIRG